MLFQDPTEEFEEAIEYSLRHRCHGRPRELRGHLGELHELGTDLTRELQQGQCVLAVHFLVAGPARSGQGDPNPEFHGFGGHGQLFRQQHPFRHP